MCGKNYTIFADIVVLGILQRMASIAKTDLFAI